ncbi:MAG: hypothetical protein ACTHMS_23480 [Jatrophihabitans sp.]|uniref:hypothetical protein n=1 Tax=Jatrophihabitans sp. TaxID=1932789 RepID=UPI003F7F6296
MPGAFLRCVSCGREVFHGEDYFDDQPIEDWWKSKGERCTPCRQQRRARGQRRPARAARSSRSLVLPRPGSRRRQVFDVARVAEGRGVTVEDLCGALGRAYGEVQPDVEALERSGLLVAAGRRRGPSGVGQGVWVAAMYADQIGVER